MANLNETSRGNSAETKARAGEASVHRLDRSSPVASQAQETAESKTPESKTLESKTPESKTLRPEDRKPELVPSEPPRAAGTGPHASAATPKKSLRRRVLFALLPLALIAGGYVYVSGGAVMSTDNAYVQADMVGVSTDVSGIVKQVLVHDNQNVAKGEVLFELDPQPFQLALDRANAQIGNTRNDLVAMQTSYRNMQAQVEQAQKDVDFNTVNFQRQEQLIANNFTPKATFDTARNTLENSQQKLASVKQQLAGVAANLNGNPDAAIEIQGCRRRTQRGGASARAHRGSRPLCRHRDQRAVIAARSIPHGGDDRLQHRLGRSRLGRGQSKGNRTDLCPARPAGDDRGRHLSGPAMDRHRRQHQPGFGIELLVAAGREYQRQLGQGGAADSDAYQRQQRARQASAAGRHERRS
jgi:multidrug efflux pump subunit AcrA (membrane-fusion protein)